MDRHNYMGKFEDDELPLSSCTHSLIVSDIPKSQTNADEFRIIHVNQDQPIKFISNVITTAKYNLITFVPKFLFEQFRRYSNCFFFFIVLLQQIPDVSPIGRFTTIYPLSFIFLVSAIKEIIEDIKRHKNDRVTNSRIVQTLHKEGWKNIEWNDTHVGDIVKIHKDEYFPADLLILSSSEPESMCYIQTTSLDGETNFKIRQGLPETAYLKNIRELNAFKGVIECDNPNRKIYDFTGTLTIRNENKIPLGPDRILLRGASLKNTAWIIGVVIYTGHETKLMKNSSSAPLKRSTIDKQTNKQILLLLVILLFLCFTGAFFNVLWIHEHSLTDWYLGIIETEPVMLFIYTSLTFIILFNNLIPISLQVTLELVRFMQAIFISQDIDMYHAESDTVAMARTSNLNEELGMVKFIFSDKTGTLTKNILEFRKISVAGEVFNEENSKTFIERIKQNHETGTILRNFLTLLSVCHTVIPEKNSETNELSYYASSPDELVLVQGAQIFGYTFDTRSPYHVELSTFFGRMKYELLKTIDFTSNRKRMSVIVRSPDNKIILYCKGADDVIFERLADNGRVYCDVTMAHLHNFANDGLRTLCCAMREIPKDKYEEWNILHRKASTALSDRVRKLEEVADLIEVDLFLIGATAVEDKLQDQVPETIDALLRADIKLWLLTGDKLETAMNIGFSTRLLNQNSKLIIIRESSLDTVRNSLTNHLHYLREELENPRSEIALIIDGHSLHYVLTPELEKDFLKLCVACKSVICCRTSPIQKAEVVELVRNNIKQITLAIGDGANDVAMIQKADVGVGISGSEGLQAASASDYSIAQFRYLQRLLFVHGSWNYSRICVLILYCFYKNICLYVTNLWFALYSGWSGQILFERWTIGFYNVFFTAAPPIIIGVFDRNYSAKTMLEHPELYHMKLGKFSVSIFWMWIFDAVFHSAFLFWFMMYSIQNEVLWQNAKDGGLLWYGNVVYTCVILSVCLKAGLHTKAWTILTHFAIWGSIFCWFAWILVYSYVWPTLPFGAEMVGIAGILWSAPIFWLGIIIASFLVISTDVIVTSIKGTFNKSETEFKRKKPVEPENLVLVESGSEKSMPPEKARLLKRDRDRSIYQQGINDENLGAEMNTGYAFSQEEGGIILQSDLVCIPRSKEKRNR